MIFHEEKTITINFLHAEICTNHQHQCLHVIVHVNALTSVHCQCKFFKGKKELTLTPVQVLLCNSSQIGFRSQLLTLLQIFVVLTPCITGITPQESLRCQYIYLFFFFSYKSVSREPPMMKTQFILLKATFMFSVCWIFLTTFYFMGKNNYFALIF